MTDVPQNAPRHLRRDQDAFADDGPIYYTKKERRRFLRRRIVAVLVLLVLVLIPVWVSLGSALTDQSLGPSPTARLAEWTRDHGGSGLVTWIENQWYSHHAPKTGGAPKKGAIPGAVHLRQLTGIHGVLPTPKAIVPLALPKIAGEGDWHPIGRTINGIPTMFDTFMRPDPVHTSQVVGVVWMDTKMLSMRLYSGSYIPGGGPYKYSAPIPPSAATSLVGAFNAGFREKDAQGGYYTDGRSVLPLRKGSASFVVYKDGSATVADWGRDAKMSKNVESVRQNLVLLVDHGKSVPGLDPIDTWRWGYTVKGAVYVWRSAIGVTKSGALVYIGGPALNITTLANLMVRAGAVRAMELDINSAWVNFASFKPTTAHGLAGPTNGTDLLSTMAYPPSHYFEPWTRDFFTASAR